MSLSLPWSPGTVPCWGQGVGPLLLKLFKKELVREGPAVHNGVKDEVECHHHAADEAEGQEGFEVLPESLQTDVHGALGRRTSQLWRLPTKRVSVWKRSRRKGGEKRHRRA